MKAVVAAFNQEKALVGAFSVIVKTGCVTDGSFYSTIKDGVITDIETVVKRRSRTLLAHDYYLGFSGYNQHQLDI